MSAPCPDRFATASPDAGELSLTDVNLALGRLISDRFPLPLSVEPALARSKRSAERLTAAGHGYAALDVAEGFFRIANASMAEAIREVTVARGFDLREHALVVFGGAGGQHACALARELGVREVLFHPLAGVLSAWGIGISRLRWEGRADAGGRALSEDALPELAADFERLVAAGRAALARDGADPRQLVVTTTLRLRYRGTETELAVAFPAPKQALARRDDLAELDERRTQRLGNQPQRPGDLRRRGNLAPSLADQPRHGRRPESSDDDSRPAARWQPPRLHQRRHGRPCARPSAGRGRSPLDLIPVEDPRS